LANELCQQRNAGTEPNIAQAAQAVSDGGEFGLNASRICEAYEEIASMVGGFKEISAH
jgi:hypothetical protein